MELERSSVPSGLCTDQRIQVSLLTNHREAEKMLKTQEGATIESVFPVIEKITRSGEALEDVIREYQRFGSQLRETVETNLRNQTSEYHLLEKVGLRSPDKRNQRSRSGHSR